MQDPFHVVRSDLTANLVATNAQLTEWRVLVQTGSQNDRYARLLQDISSSVQGLDLDLQDLAETIAIVEGNPSRYNLDAAELAARKDFVAATTRNIQEIRAALNAGQTKVVLVQREALLSPPSNGKLGGEPRANTKAVARQADNGRFVEDESNRQQMIMRQQDQQLDGVLGTVSTLKHVALTMGQELDDQVGLLREVDDRVDNTQGKLKSAMARMNVILKSNSDNKSTCCIVVLVVVLVVLLVFVAL